LQAYDWRMLEHRAGYYRVECQLPSHVRNPRGQLFGGFAPTYVDLIAIRAAHSTLPEGPRGMATVNMRVDYFDPVVEDRFVLEGRVVHNRGRTYLCEVTFKDLAGKLLIFSIVTLRQRSS
jgi:uncharacterized protein (TIGR00369 family)